MNQVCFLSLLRKKKQMPPILAACINNDKDAVLAMINANAHDNINLNFQEHHGNTALIYAALEGNEEIVKLLLLAGADSKIKNNQRKLLLMLLIKTLKIIRK